MAKLSAVEAVTNRRKIYSAAAGVEAYDAVCLDPDNNNQVTRADAGDPTLKDMIGFAVQKFANGKVLVEGAMGVRVENPSWTWSRGQELYVASGDPGKLTATPPHSDFLQRVAIANSAIEVTVMVDRQLK